ncbi:MAG TPA: hemolysin family protein [Rhodothermia bacterium]
MSILLIILMLILSAFFSGSEIAFISANRLKVEARASGDGFAARSVRHFLHRPEEFLVTTLVGNNLALVLYSSLLAFVLEPNIRDLWSSVISFVPGIEIASFLTQTIIATTIVLLLGEILPKSAARQIADKAVFLVAAPLKAFYYILLPFNKVSGWTARVIVRLFGEAPQDTRRVFRREIEATLRESSRKGEIDLDEQGSRLLSNVFRISKLRVKDSMVPRTDIEGVEEDASIETARNRFAVTGYSKLPVYRENIDNIVGVVFAYDLFQDPVSIKDMLREVRFVPDTKKSRDLLAEFLDDRVSIAIVIDEYGGTAGIVTIEDLIEELTGEIHDEFDADEFVARKLDERTFIVSGRAEIAELRKTHGILLQEGDYETVAGFLLEHLGYIPATNEEVVVGAHRFVVVKARSNRIDLVKVIRTRQVPAG